MRTRSFRAAQVAGALLCLIAGVAPANALDQATRRLASLEYPDGFSVHLFANNVHGARSLAISPNGVVYVGTKDYGRVYALRDRDGDKRADEVFQIADGLIQPTGVAFLGTTLYVAETHRVIAFPDIENNLRYPPEPIVVVPTLPTNAAHGSRTLETGPDGRIYMTIGAPCNSCEPKDPHHATIVRFDPNNPALEVMASGVRNSTGLAFHPLTKELWFTDAGREGAGEKDPGDELNKAPAAGLHFGFPYCHGLQGADPIHGGTRPCSGFTPPVQVLDAGAEVMGLAVLETDAVPAEWRDRILVAEHGSSYRNPPKGDRIAAVKMANGVAVGYENFFTGWRTGGRVWGRPTDLLLLSDGSLLVSDDVGDAVYRFWYAPPAPAPVEEEPEPALDSTEKPSEIPPVGSEALPEKSPAPETSPPPSPEAGAVGEAGSP